jgi:hypothetical protein
VSDEPVLADRGASTDDRWPDHVKNTELLDAELPDTRFVDGTYLQWLYDLNPLGRAYSAAIDDGEGSRIGHYALIPQRYRNRHGEAKFVFSLNAVARQGHQRRGFFGRLGNVIWGAAQADGVKVVVGVMNLKSTGSVRKNGWRILGPLPVKIVVPTPVPPRDVDSYEITPEFLATPAFTDIAAGLDESPAWHWTNCWTAESLRWRLAAPNSARYTLHRSRDLVGISTLTHERGVPVVVVLKLLPRDGRFGPISAHRLISAMCRHHRAPVALYTGHNRHVTVPGVRLPERLKPVPLNLGLLSLSDEVDQNTFQLDTFEFLDMDAY